MYVPFALRDLFFPGECLHCGNDHGERGHDGLCDLCQKLLRYYEGNQCRRCSMPLRVIEGALCRSCRFRPPLCGKLIVLGWYEGALRSIVKAGKFSRDLSAAPRLIARALPLLDSARYDAVTSVPSDHPFAGSLADRIADRLGVRRIDPLRRVKGAVRQGGLSRKRRRANAGSAFTRVDLPLPQSILVIDDVVTTGATMDAVAQRLIEGGAGIVDGLAIARAPLGKQRSVFNVQSSALNIER